MGAGHDLVQKSSVWSQRVDLSSDGEFQDPYAIQQEFDWCIDTLLFCPCVASFGCSQVLPRKLEHWLTEEGGKVVEKAAALGGASLSSDERLLREVWLFDTEIRNGGVSQYFGNWGNEQWATLCKGARPTLPSFSEFAGMVDKIVVGQEDPYLSVIGAGDTLDRAYYAVQTRLVTELRAYLRGRRRQV